MQDIVDITHKLGYEVIPSNHIGKVKVAININDLINMEPRYTLNVIAIVDTSGSMQDNNKLPYAQAVLEYTLDNLREEDNLCLIKFSDEAINLSNGFVSMIPDNKRKMLDLIKQLRPESGTNMVKAIDKAAEILRTIDINDMSCVTSILFLTDGLDNTFYQSKPIDQYIKDTVVPQLNNIVSINTFGFGPDHDSKILSEIALNSNGLYYYVPSAEFVGATFGQCLANLNNTTVSNMRLRINAYKGCRIINIINTRSRSPKIDETLDCKDYTIYLGNLFRSETYTVIVELSLNKVDEVQLQDILDIRLFYINTTKGIEQIVDYGPIQVKRDVPPEEQTEAPEIIAHLNRINAANAITQALNSPFQAVEILDKMIQKLESQIDVKELIEDLNKCKVLFINRSQHSRHTIYSYAVMHYTQRSTGFTDDIVNEVEDTSLRNTLTSARYSMGYSTSASQYGYQTTKDYSSEYTTM